MLLKSIVLIKHIVLIVWLKHWLIVSMWKHHWLRRLEILLRTSIELLLVLNGSNTQKSSLSWLIKRRSTFLILTKHGISYAQRRTDDAYILLYSKVQIRFPHLVLWIFKVDAPNSWLRHRQVLECPRRATNVVWLIPFVLILNLFVERFNEFIAPEMLFYKLVY